MYLETTALRLSFHAESGDARRPRPVRCSVVPPTRGDERVKGRPVHDRPRAEHAAGPRGAGDPEIVGGGQHGDIVTAGAEEGRTELQQRRPAWEFCSGMPKLWLMTSPRWWVMT